MSKHNDGGPAFPCPSGGWRVMDGVSLTGLSVRDYFAASAMQAQITHYGNEGRWDSCARYAYEIADAMLAERDKEDS